MEHPIPNPLMIVPFGALLLMVALAPLFFADWWHHHYPKVAIALGAVTVGYYLLGLRAPGRVVEVAHEYFSFIALIGSLFIVAGAGLFSWTLTSSQDIPTASSFGGGTLFALLLIALSLRTLYKSRDARRMKKAKLEFRQQRLRELLAALDARE